MKKTITYLSFLLMICTPLYAGSVDTFGIGAKATSLGGAVSASVDDVFAAYYNPAGLAQINGKSLTLGIHVADPSLKISDFTVKGGAYSTGTDFTQVGPITTKDKSDNFYVPSFGYAQSITDKISIGFAAYIPFGLDVEWDNNPSTNPAANNWYHSYYGREVITPTFAYKLNDKYSFGLGVSLGKSKSGAEKILNFTAPTTLGMPSDTYDETTANTLISGGLMTATQAAQWQALAGAYAYNGKKLELELEDDFNYSFNLGFMYKANEKFSAGVTYRSKTDADFDGTAEIAGIKVSDASQSYDHPDQIQMGVCVKPVSNVSIAMDVVWTNWSMNSTQVTTFDTPLLGQISTETLERDWNDTNQLRLGLEWQYNKMFSFRTGYFYDPSPVPDDTFDAMWPDADKKTYSIGTGITLDKFVIDISIQYAVAETKRIIGGESENLNDSYNTTGVLSGNEVVAKADGYLLGYGATLTYNF